MELPIGAPVHCRDGEAGRLRYVVVDPDRGAITDLIVQHGRLLKRDIVVPITWVERSDATTIVLRASCADLEVLPTYREVEFTRPDPTYRPASGHRLEDTRVWLGPYAEIGGGHAWFVDKVRLGIEEEDAVLIRRGMPVRDARGERIGRIHHLGGDAQHHLSHLVIRRGDLVRHDYRIVPAAQIAAIDDDGVQLKLDAAAIDQLPRYTLPVADTDLQARAQQALDHDGRTAGSALRVTVEEGIARLQGSVAAPVARAGQQIVERMRGILGVIDETTRPPAPTLPIGAAVHARDGRYGSLEKVVVDPHARRVTHLVIGTGWLAKEHRIVPIEAVKDVDAHGIHLEASADELHRLPSYREESFITPDPSWEPLEDYSATDTLFWDGPYPGVAAPRMPVIEHRTYAGVPAGAITLRRGIDVLCQDALVGVLDHLLVDPRNGRMTHLIVEEQRTGRRVIVPSEWVHELHEQAIILRVWRPDQAGLPRFELQRSDSELAAHVRSALETSPELAAVEVEVEAGVAHLRGNVASIQDKADADARARAVPGIVDVHNALTADSALTARITAALADEAATALAPIEVIALHGVVTLQGTVPTPQARERAEAIARGIPGVRTVINALEVRPAEDDPWHVWPGALIER